MLHFYLVVEDISYKSGTYLDPHVNKFQSVVKMTKKFSFICEKNFCTALEALSIFAMLRMRKICCHCIKIFNQHYKLYSSRRLFTFGGLSAGTYEVLVKYRCLDTGDVSGDYFANSVTIS